MAGARVSRQRIQGIVGQRVGSGEAARGGEGGDTT